MDDIGGMGAGMDGINWLAATTFIEDSSSNPQVVSKPKFGRIVSAAEPVIYIAIPLQGYGLNSGGNKKLTHYVISEPLNTPLFLRQQWFVWANNQFQCKGYAPSVAKVMAERVLTQCGSDYRSVKIMVNTTPLSPQSAFRGLQQQNYQWAMGQFTAKGYRPDRAHQAIVNALNTAGSNLTGFQQWVSDAPYAQSNKNANTLRPWMIQQIEKKGFTPEEAQAVADDLIKKSGGNVDHLHQSVGKIRPRGVPHKLTAEQMKQRNQQSLKALGLSEGASLTDVKKAYRLLALRHHPDRNPENEESKEIFQTITEANRHLTENSDLFKSQR